MTFVAFTREDELASPLSSFAAHISKGAHNLV